MNRAELVLSVCLMRVMCGNEPYEDELDKDTPLGSINCFVKTCAGAGVCIVRLVFSKFQRCLLPAVDELLGKVGSINTLMLLYMSC